MIPSDELSILDETLADDYVVAIEDEIPHSVVKREASANIQPIPRDPTSPYTPGTYAYNFTKFGHHVGSNFGLNNNYSRYRADFFKRYGYYPSAADYSNRVRDLSGARFNARYGHLSRFEVKRRFGHLTRSQFYQRYGYYPPVNYNFGTAFAPEYWY